ncbi:MAG: M28 family metallopeptidase [Promethearchaeota archaeon]
MIKKSESFLELNDEEIKKLAKSSMEFTKNTIDEIGPRLPCSEESRKTAEKLKEILSPYCDHVATEEFKCHPKAFLGSIKVLAILSIFASISFLFMPIVSFILVSIGALVFTEQFIFYRETFDRFYKEKTGKNFSATIEPLEETKNIIIFSGHHDSVWEFNWMYRTPNLYVLRDITSILMIVIFLVISLVISIKELILGHIITNFLDLYDWKFWISLLSLLMSFPAIFFTSNRGVPGAGDNLIATGIIFSLAKYFGDLKKENNKAFRNTKLIFLSFDAEEAGIRGSRRYVEAHLDELKNDKIPVTHINIDSIYDSDKILTTITDLNGTVRSDRELANRLKNIAEELDINFGFMRIVIPFGSTDSASFAKFGISSTTLMGINTKNMPKVYHTRNDTIEHVNPDLVEKMIRILFAFLQKNAN